ncbi:2-polyprenyl-6-methoxyphenol hydroxylase-like FAD-dependent oxidoreductase [Pelomonas saccharophila]|uniref:2-polyprenyl-6-methoxyphenol hydroxylase-like FAD-dependent oxidoreductase n=1 Tax=Roseateles saccharophilus TaxID=304 RepID=A0ABU1YMJ7_ROSSA|nr:flavin-dependent oxidoreductase [Roseateles saccharophilus]MDR7270083.1 2-polyprenyl-6-methoxyphenol hydroxylase-like FAD-dependent oxidoreductase [Roseateles saccharophilus]
MKILIAGGGIGGLTAALALKARGHDVTVLESVREPRPLGVGINLLPHAVGVLDELGLLPALREMAVETSALVFANRHGQAIHRDPRGLAGGYSHPQFSIHRGELQMRLWREASARVTVLSGQRVVGVRDGNIALIETADGPRELAADLIVGADGIHSALRRRLAPDEGPPCWRGVMMWRGTSWAPPFLDGRTMVQAGYSQAKFVVYPIGAPRADGLQLINWIADRRVHEPTPGLTAPDRADWSRTGKLDDLLPTFGSWHFDWLDVPGLITRAEQMLEWPMVDRDPLPRWRLGPSTLLGDAAHPMYPIGSNGATQAIMDARALAEALTNHADLETALAAYEDERRPLCARIVEMNRREGLDAILDRVEALAPDGFARLEDVIDPAEVAAEINSYKAAAGHRLQAARG